MQIAGIRLPDTLVLELAATLRRKHGYGTAELLEAAVATNADSVNLDITDREYILRALEDPPAGLEVLRTVLLNEQAWRRSQRL